MKTIEEQLDVVDWEDNVVDIRSRREVREHVLIHRVVRGIITKKDQYLLHKRTATKDFYPGLWDIGMAETVQSGEDYVQATLRGLSEELGITAFSKEDVVNHFVQQMSIDREDLKEILRVYSFEYDGDVVAQPEEVETITWMTAAEIQQFMKDHEFHPIGKMVIEQQVLT